MRLFELITEDRPRSTSPELIQKIKDLYDQGIPIKDIALQVGKLRKVVNYILHRYIQDREKNRLSPATPELIQKVKDLWDQGLTYPKIASKLGISEDKVSYIITEYYKDKKTRHELSTPEEIQQVKDLWNQDIAIKDIALQLGIKPHRVSDIVAKYYKERELRNTFHSSELIQQVKDLYDQGLPGPETASKLGITLAQVDYILERHYSERTPRVMDYTPELIQSVKDLWDQGLPMKKIALEVGKKLSQVDTILNRYYKDRERRAALFLPTPEEKDRAIKMFTNGVTNKGIGQIFGVVPTTIARYMERLPNFEELLGKRLAAIDAHKEAAKLAQANTKIYRPGEIGNLRSRGPGTNTVRATKNKKYFE